MFKPSNARLGNEIGLTGQFADKPAFQIVNDAHDLVFSVTAQIMHIKHGARGSRLRKDSRWTRIDAKRTEFNRRVHALEDDAVEAAALVSELRRFRADVLAPIASAANNDE